VAAAQTVCPPTPEFTPCEIVFNIPSADPGKPLDLQAEFRSPHLKTGLAKAFWDGGTRWVIRYTAAEPGTYVWRITSSLPGLGGKQGTFTATPNGRPGWLRAANVHHFAFVDEADPNHLTPHLWMGAMVPGFASMSLTQWKSLVDMRASQHFNHLGVTLVDEAGAGNFRTPEFFRAAEEKLLYANQKGIIVDLAFYGPNGLMNRLLPSHEERQKWFIYALSRLAAYDVTWQGIEGWESYDNGRDLLKEIARYLADLDPYKHTRSTRANSSSGPVVDDGWLRYRSYQTADDAIGSIGQQIYQYPAVNNFAGEPADADTFRHRLWNATMNGQYPSTAIPNEQAAAEMKIWYEFMQGTRHWELEPYFDVENGRGLALEGVEYIIYVENPGPVTVNIEKHGYDVRWFNPATGESIKEKDVKSEVFTGEPPDRSHDWVLQISREGEKASMLKSYRFDSREEGIQLQQIEGNPEKAPFDVVEPSGQNISLASPPHFSIRLKRESKALKRMTYEWTGEVTVDGRSYRVIGTGASGTFSIPANVASHYPAALHVRIYGMNGLGKVYALDRNYTLTK
ncbi:MAG TPA: DUF5060 domain-containing protein, partial [Bryobacteraceae bacterium]|nr:DUF5060 domain-containing protein [Bryobacteraceae bacterium]